MKARGSKSLNNTLKDKIQIGVVDKYEKFHKNVNQEKNLTPIKKFSDTQRFEKKLNNNLNNNKSQNIQQQKTSFSTYKTGAKNLNQNVDNKNFHFTDRNFNPQLTSMRFHNKTNKKTSYIIDCLNETDKSTSEHFSPVQIKERNNTQKMTQNSTSKESTSILKIKIKHTPVKHSLMESRHFRKNEIVINRPFQSPPRNIKIVYSELAKQLKNNKKPENSKDTSFNQNYSINLKINKEVIKTPPNEVNTSQNLLIAPNNNQSVDNILHSNFKISSRTFNNQSNINSVITRTTKDNTVSQSTNNLQKNKQFSVQFENPEELHFHNVSLIQQSKILAYKFDNFNVQNGEAEKNENVELDL